MPGEKMYLKATRFFDFRLKRSFGWEQRIYFLLAPHSNLYERSGTRIHNFHGVFTEAEPSVARRRASIYQAIAFPDSAAAPVQRDNSSSSSHTTQTQLHFKTL